MFDEKMVEFGNKKLHTKGNTDLLNKPGIAIVGSRDASDKAQRIAERLGVRFAEAGINVVSGYARGIDASAHKGALAGRGTTTVVLPTGIRESYVRGELKEYWTPNRVLVVSEFEPNAPFSGRQAMARNKTICEMSKAVIIVQIGIATNSGTAGTFREALKMGKPVYIIDQRDLEPNIACGNDTFAARGGHPVGLQQIADEGVQMFMGDQPT